MHVIKRNGSTSLFDFTKIEKVIRHAIEDEEMLEDFLGSLQIQLKNEMTTKELQKTLIQLAIEKTSVQNPQWDKVATKLYMYDVIKASNVNRGIKKFGYGNLYKLISTYVKTEKPLYHKDMLKYSKAEIDELDTYIKPERDELLSYNGAMLLIDRYCVRGHDKEILEKPQEAFMGVAMFLALAESPETRIDWAKKYYDTLSRLEMTVATPTMSNARKPHNQLSSCFINVAEDSLESIFNVNDIFSQVSKHGGGQGLYFGKVRASGSDIRGFKGTSGGVVPWLRIFNDTAIACNQLGNRAGSISITLDIWHRDIFDFLNLKTDNGDERMKAHDIFPAISVPDLFMRKLKEKGSIYLFCPHEIRTVKGWSLEDSWGEEWERKYEECVNDERIPKREVKAFDLLKPLIKSATETGSPFLFFRDTVNKMNPNKHAGMIYCTNLCTEVMENMSANGEVERKTVIDKNGNEVIIESRKAGTMVVCNLSSLNLGKVHTKEKIEEVVPLAMRMMDSVIDLNFYPVQEAKISNKKYRAVGLGSSGLHHMLAINGIKFESDEHLSFVDQVFENIAYTAINASKELAKEKGKYDLFEGSDWNTGKFFEIRGLNDDKWSRLKEEVMEVGVRNSYMIAIAPNSASSIYGNSTQSIDPIYSPFYMEERKGSVVPVIAPDLNPKTFWLYKSASKIDQSWVIKSAAVRQKWIDQSQSLNIYITPETTSVEIAKLYMMAWEMGIKSTYYVRNLSSEIEDCSSCSA